MQKNTDLYSKAGNAFKYTSNASQCRSNETRRRKDGSQGSKQSIIDGIKERVKGYNRDPWPPPKIIESTLLLIIGYRIKD